MYVYEIADILFYIKSLKQPSDKFNVLNHVDFTTRSSGIKLYPRIASTNYIMNSYFYRLPRLWSSLPIIDLSQSLDVIKSKLKNFLWNHFLTIPHFISTTCVPVPIAARLLQQTIIVICNYSTFVCNFYIAVSLSLTANHL